MTEAYNGDRWIIYFFCDYTRMNHVFTKPKKSMTLSTIKEFETWISRRYNQLIRIIRVDGERSLGKDFDDWTAGKGITVEQLAPYTPTQNGTAE